MTLDATTWMQRRDVYLYAGDISDTFPPTDPQAGPASHDVDHPVSTAREAAPQNKAIMNDGRSPAGAVGAHDGNHNDDCCKAHVRHYLRAPFLADEARQINGGQYEGCYTADVITPGVPPSLRRALQEWAIDESTPDEDIAEFIGWTVERVREHR